MASTSPHSHAIIEWVEVVAHDVDVSRIDSGCDSPSGIVPEAIGAVAVEREGGSSSARQAEGGSAAKLSKRRRASRPISRDRLKTACYGRS